MKKQLVSIVIPEYNEQESLQELTDQINDVFAKTSFVHEFIYIDDGSTDGSFEVLKKIKENLLQPMTIIRFRKNLGKSAALSTGFSYVKGDYVVTMDADLQDDPTAITKLIETLDQGNDLVVGWRNNRQDKPGKIVMSYIFNTIVAKAGGLTLHDMNSGLKAFRTVVTQEIELYGELHRFIPYLAAMRGFRVTEIPVAHHNRKFGTSKFGTGRIFASFDLLTTIFITSFKHRPLKIFGIVGSLFIFTGIVLLSYLSYLHFMGESIGTRPLLSLGILFVLSGVQVFSTGLLGELITSHARKEQYPVAEIIT